MTTAMTQYDHGRIKQPKPPPPVTTDSLQAERDLLHVGRLAREVLEAAKLPRHWWQETFAHELVVAALGRLQVERKRVLEQRHQLRQLHAKVMQQKGELASKSHVVKNLLTTLERQKTLIEEMKRNR